METYRLKKIAGLVKTREMVLDLGCSALPNVFLNNSNLIGMDLNTAKLSPNYKKLVVGNALQLPDPFEKDSFDAITAGEIIEHVDHPMEFLRCCNATLKRGGVLVISTPNPNSIWERLLTLTLSRKFFYTSDHVCLYPQRWLIRMFEIAGFKDVKIVSGGLTLPGILVNIPFPRPWAEYSIVYGTK